jgi:hypothetical membrane protein
MGAGIGVETAEKCEKRSMTGAGESKHVVELRNGSKELPFDRTTSSLAICGVVGPLLFIGVYTILGALRPGYSAFRQAVSDLGVGPNAWILNDSGLACAVLMIASVMAFYRRLRGDVIGILRWISAVLLTLPPIGLAVAGIFTEARATVRIHWLVGGTLLFRSPAVAFLFAGLALCSSSRWRKWGIVSLIAGFGELAMWTAFSRNSPLASLHLGLGFTERAIVIWIFGWYVLGSLQLVRDRKHAAA